MLKNKYISNFYNLFCSKHSGAHFGHDNSTVKFSLQNCNLKVQ